jgi:hypothetical protein
VQFLGLFISGHGYDTFTPIAGMTEIRPRQALDLSKPEGLQRIDWTCKRCEVASAGSMGHVIACARPATALVKTRDARPYFMCEMCECNSVQNCGASVMAKGPATKSVLGAGRAR